MAKSSPEKLAYALRANLKRRKQGPKGAEDGRAAKPVGPPPAPAAEPPKTSG